MSWLDQIVHALQTLDWRTLAPSALGAVLGGAISAATSTIMARRSSRETLKRDQISRAEDRKAATLRALVKLLIIVNGIDTLYRHVEQMIADADAQGHADFGLWQKVMPVTGISKSEVRFEASDVVAFVSKDTAYINELLLLAERYATLTEVFRDYSTRRAKLTDQLPATMVGSLGTTFLTPSQAAQFAPRAHELNVLVGQLREFLSLDRATAFGLAQQFGPKARTVLGDPSFPVLSTVAATATQSNPQTAA